MMLAGVQATLVRFVILGRFAFCGFVACTNSTNRASAAHVRDKSLPQSHQKRRENKIVWFRTIGGVGSDLSTNVVADSTGATIVLGWPSESVWWKTRELVGQGKRDILVGKFASDGRRQWALVMGGPSLDFPGDVAADYANDVYIMVFFATETEVQERSVLPGWHVLKFDGRHGRLMWLRQLPESVDYQPQFALRKSDVMVVGDSRSVTYLFSLDGRDGELQFETSMERPEPRETSIVRRSIAADKDLVYIAGESRKLQPALETAVVAFEADSGSERWRRRLVSSTDVRLLRVRTGLAGVCAMGEFRRDIREMSSGKSLDVPPGRSKNFVVCWNAGGVITKFAQLGLDMDVMDFVLDRGFVAAVGKDPSTRQSVLCWIDDRECVQQIALPLYPDNIARNRLAVLGGRVFWVGTFQGEELAEFGVRAASDDMFLMAVGGPRGPR